MNEQQEIIMFEIGGLINDFNSLTDYQGDQLVVALREKIDALVELTHDAAREAGYDHGESDGYHAGYEAAMERA